MATYHFYKQGYEIPFDNFGFCVLRKHLDVPAIIASGVVGYSPLAVGGVRTALASTGFAAADILNLFRVPAGFLVLGGGLKVTTAGSATTTIDVGYATGTQTADGVAATGGGANTADVGFWLETAVISAVGNFPFDATTGTVWYPGTPFVDLYVTDGSIDVTFNTAAQLTLIADFWVYGAKVY